MSKFNPISLALLTLAAQPVFAPAQAQSQDGWINLFNGRDLSGWTQKTGTAKYWVEDSCIVGQTVTGTRTNSFLCTDKDYDNFILELEFKVDPRLNSGIQFRSAKSETPASIEWNGRTINVPAGYVYGYQYEIDPAPRMWTGGIYDERRRTGATYPGGGQVQSPEGREFTEIGRKIYKPEDWNTARIEAVGDSIKTYLNGVLRTELRDSLSLKGLIGLQVHQIGDDKSKEGAQVRFRNVRLKPMLASAAPAASTSAINSLTEQEKTEGWRLLWDGKTSEGWRSPKSENFPQNGWVIKDGTLNVVGNNGAESAGGGDIITRERFSNFELVVDFKLTPGANSGIKYFVQPNLNPITGSGAATAVGSAIGLEYQILDDERHPDAKLGRNGNRTLGSVYDLKAADAAKQPNAIGEWNTARILSQGRQVTYWLNGKKILELERGTPEFRQLVAQSKYHSIPGFGEWADGHILLQEHGDAVSYRNIKLRVPRN